jgi:glycosyltransferase involved in cell wall biosynthesis
MSVLHIHARDIVRFDAVGNFARQTGALAAQTGWNVRLWAEHADVFDDRPVEPRERFNDALSPSDLIFFNHSIFDPILPRIAALPNRKILYFHNVTPPELIDAEDARTVENCRAGIAQRASFGAFDALMANSAATARFLLEGLSPADRGRFSERIVVSPPIVGTDRWMEWPERNRHDRARESLLFVGRLVRHKGIDDLLALFEALTSLRTGFDLDLIGGPSSGSYVEALKTRAMTIEGANGGRVAFHHDVPDAMLARLYRRATAFVTMSRHEGFCVPALDALFFDKPVFARSDTAVMEVLGEAAVVLPGDTAKAAAAIHGFFSSDSMQSANKEARARRIVQWRGCLDGARILQTLEAVRRAP